MRPGQLAAIEHRVHALMGDAVSEVCALVVTRQPLREHILPDDLVVDRPMSEGIMPGGIMPSGITPGARCPGVETSTPRGAPALVEASAIPRGSEFPRSFPAALAAASQRGARLIHVAQDGSEQIEPVAMLRERALRVLAALRRVGLTPGDRVLVDCRIPRDALAVICGCMLGKLVAVPFLESSHDCSRLRGVHEQLGVAAVVSATVTGLPSPRSTPAELEACEPSAEAAEPADEQLALIMLTSGSTGAPKGVEVRHGMLVELAWSMHRRMLRLGEGDTTLAWMPFDHLGSLGFLVLAALFSVNTVVVAEPEAIIECPRRWSDLVERHRVTMTWAPNFALGLLAQSAADQPSACGRDLSSLRIVVNAGDTVTREATQAFVSAFAAHGVRPDVLCPAFGMTETTTGITFVQGTSFDGPFASLGRPVPGVAIRIVDDDDNLVTEGRRGRLQIRGAQIFSGYFGRPRETEAAFTADSWFDTGDLGYLRAGELYLTGRTKDMIVAAGKKFAAAEIEAALQEIPGVSPGEVAVVPFRPAGAEVDRVFVLFVRDRQLPWRDGPTLTRAIAGRLATGFGLAPRGIVEVEPEGLPRTGLGKIMKARLIPGLSRGPLADVARDSLRLIGSADGMPAFVARLEDRAVELPRTPGSAAALSTPELSTPALRCVGLTTSLVPDRSGAHLVVDVTGAEPGTVTSWLSDVAPRHASPIALVSAGPPNAEERARRAAIRALVRSWQSRHQPGLRAIDLDEPFDETRPDHRAAVSVPGAVVLEQARGRWWQPKLIPVGIDEIRASGSEALRGAHVVISGGLGGVGRLLAERLQSAYACWLTLVGRTPPEALGPAAQHALAGLRERGAVSYAVGDVAAREWVRAAVEANEARWRAPARFAFHLAGDDGDSSSFAELVRTRVEGGTVLRDLVVGERDGVLVSCGSVSGVLGMPEHETYAAAQAVERQMLTSTGSSRVRHLAFSAITDTGMARGRASSEVLRAAGLWAVPPELVLAYLEMAALRPVGALLIGIDDVAPAHGQLRLAPPPEVEEVVAAVCGPRASDGAIDLDAELGGRIEVRAVDSLPRDRDGAVDRQRLADQLVSHRALRDAVDRLIAREWVAILGGREPGLDDNFFVAGGESIALMRYVARLREAFRLPIETRIVVTEPTVAGVARHLLNIETQPGFVLAIARAREQLPRSREAVIMSASSP
jgi:acyl-CoA synthetase (AMP-forming)/AMP-acid ligase II/NAD(P)-dependent dehydrogenase (short-subunit alcohol dehydrogenase family)